jgi:hypothetical protein
MYNQAQDAPPSVESRAHVCVADGATETKAWRRQSQYSVARLVCVLYLVRGRREITRILWRTAAAWRGACGSSVRGSRSDKFVALPDQYRPAPAFLERRLLWAKGTSYMRLLHPSITRRCVEGA